MRSYRLVIHQHGRLLGHFDATATDALEAVKAISRQLPEAEGFTHELLTAEDEDRILEVNAGRIRVISSTPRFRSLS